MTSVTGNLACTRASSTQTRCRGRFESADGLYAQRVSLAVTWQNGKPVKITH
jgi:hypothetical protein